MRSLDPQMLEQVAREEWWFTARPEQVPPEGDWTVCLILAGRGFGKSKLATEWLIERVEKHPVDRNGFRTEWLAISETLADARSITIDGASGILRILKRKGYKPGFIGPGGYKYTQHPKPKIEIGEFGTCIYFEGADGADVGRGYNAAGAILDELAKWKHSKESWYEGIMPSLRADLIDDHPRALVATTPKPIELIREWVNRGDGTVHLIRGSTFDNAANLNEYTLEEMRRRYAGTSLGRQELYGELIDDRDGTLFKFGDIDNNRVTEQDIEDVSFTHLCVAVDPTLTEDGDEMGVVVIGRDGRNHMYVLSDDSVPLAGKAAAHHIWRVFHRWGADTVVYESNLGKAWMKQVLTDAYIELRDKDLLFPEKTTPPLKAVDARQGKKLRAEPVALRYEQGTVHHVGEFGKMEEEMFKFDPTDSHNSPNRMDALVHGARHLIAGETKRLRVSNAASLWIATR